MTKAPAAARKAAKNTAQPTAQARKPRPGPAAAPEVRKVTPDAAGPPKGKLGTLVALLRRPQGASIAEMMSATGWQAHSIRGAMSGSLKKKAGLAVLSEKSESGRRYRIEAKAAG